MSEYLHGERWSPLKIEILLHYHCYTTEYEWGANSAKLDAMRDLQRDGLLGFFQVVPPQFRLTIRGKAFVMAMLNTPIPAEPQPEPECKFRWLQYMQGWSTNSGHYPYIAEPRTGLSHVLQTWQDGKWVDIPVTRQA